MAAISIADILSDIAPETDLLTADKKARLIALAKAQVHFACGDQRNLAIAYLAAHMNALSTRGGVGGNITAEREGDLSRSFGASGPGGALGATSYGAEFDRIRRQSIFMPRTRAFRGTDGC